jgi:hypothetical protein
MYHIGLLFQGAQNYHGVGLASAMRTDIMTDYDGTILKNLIVTKKWFNTMVQKMVRTPPLASNRKEIAKEVYKHNCWGY